MGYPQLDAAHGIDGGAVAGTHQDGGELRLQDGGAVDLRSGGQRVGGECRRVLPLAQVDAAGAIGVCRDIGGGLLELGDPGKFADSGDAESDQPHLLILLVVRVEFLVPAVEIVGQAGDELRVGQRRVRQRHGDFVDLVEVAHVGGVLNLHGFGGQALIEQLVASLAGQLVQDGAEFVKVGPVQADRVGAEEVVLDVGVQHPVGR